jgi:hypothetical protein
MWIIGQLINAVSGQHRVQLKPLADVARDRIVAALRVDFHLPAQEVIRIEIAQHDVGVGHCRLSAAQPVAGRSGYRAGA